MAQTFDMKNKDTYFPNNNQNSNRNWYIFARNFKRFAQNNLELIKPIHYALYFWIVEMNNELRWPDDVMLHPKETMSGIGIKDREKYYKTLNDLNTFGLINIVQRATSRYNPNKVSLTIPEKDFIPLEPTSIY